MGFHDPFRAYAPRFHGELEAYLVGREIGGADNLFRGTRYFFVIRDRGFMKPGITYVRIDNSFVPDTRYFVNSGFMLESRGRSHANMSLVGAEIGVYDPDTVLRNQFWSIFGLIIPEEHYKKWKE